MRPSSGGRRPFRSMRASMSQLELDSGELRPRYPATLRRRGTVAQWDCGTALEDNTNERVSASSSASQSFIADGATLTGICAWRMQAVRIVAQQHGLAVQPMSLIFLWRTWPQPTAVTPFATAVRLQLTFGNWSSGQRRARGADCCSAPPP